MRVPDAICDHVVRLEGAAELTAHSAPLLVGAPGVWAHVLKVHARPAPGSFILTLSFHGPEQKGGPGWAQRSCGVLGWQLADPLFSILNNYFEI